MTMNPIPDVSPKHNFPFFSLSPHQFLSNSKFSVFFQYMLGTAVEKDFELATTIIICKQTKKNFVLLFILC
jgi:hypothetical protein